MSETTRTAATRPCKTCAVRPCVCPCKHCSEDVCVCTPEEKFVRLANTRGTKFVHVCKLLKNLGISYAYDINAEVAEELLEHFDTKLGEVRKAWEDKIAKSKETAVAVEAVSVE